MLVRWHSDGPDSPAFKEHVSRIPDYLWYVCKDSSVKAAIDLGVLTLVTEALILLIKTHPWCTVLALYPVVLATDSHFMHV